jgi:hypothetical protein
MPSISQSRRISSLLESKVIEFNTRVALKPNDVNVNINMNPSYNCLYKMVRVADAKGTSGGIPRQIDYGCFPTMFKIVKLLLPHFHKWPVLSADFWTKGRYGGAGVMANQTVVEFQERLMANNVTIRVTVLPLLQYYRLLYGDAAAGIGGSALALRTLLQRNPHIRVIPSAGLTTATAKIILAATISDVAKFRVFKCSSAAAGDRVDWGIRQYIDDYRMDDLTQTAENVIEMLILDPDAQDQVYLPTPFAGMANLLQAAIPDDRRQALFGGDQQGTYEALYGLDANSKQVIEWCARNYPISFETATRFALDRCIGSTAMSFCTSDNAGFPALAEHSMQNRDNGTFANAQTRCCGYYAGAPEYSFANRDQWAIPWTSLNVDMVVEDYSFYCRAAGYRGADLKCPIETMESQCGEILLQESDPYTSSDDAWSNMQTMYLKQGEKAIHRFASVGESLASIVSTRATFATALTNFNDVNWANKMLTTERPSMMAKMLWKDLLKDVMYFEDNVQLRPVSEQPLAVLEAAPTVERDILLHAIPQYVGWNLFYKGLTEAETKYRALTKKLQVCNEERDKAIKSAGLYTERVVTVSSTQIFLAASRRTIRLSNQLSRFSFAQPLRTAFIASEDLTPQQDRQCVFSALAWTVDAFTTIRCSIASPEWQQGRRRYVYNSIVGPSTLNAESYLDIQQDVVNAPKAAMMPEEDPDPSLFA